MDSGDVSGLVMLSGCGEVVGPDARRWSQVRVRQLRRAGGNKAPSPRILRYKR